MSDEHCYAVAIECNIFWMTMVSTGGACAVMQLRATYFGLSGLADADAQPLYCCAMDRTGACVDAIEGNMFWIEWVSRSGCTATVLLRYGLHRCLCGYS